MSERRIREQWFCLLSVFAIADTDILHLDMMGSHIVVLSNTGVAAELLEQRSRIYCDKVCEPFGISLNWSSSHQYLTSATNTYGKGTVRSALLTPYHTDKQ